MRVLLLLLLVLVSFMSVHAQEQKQVVSAGITPDSPLWKLDIMVEKIQVILTFSPKEKVKKQLMFAEERLAEAEELASENKTEYAVVALEHEKTLLQEINRTSASIGDESGLATAIEMLERHRQRLEQRRESILEKLPEDSPAREKLEQAFERIEEHSEAVEEHIRSVRKMHREQMEQVLDIIEEETGIDAEEEYDRLMTEGRISDNAIQKVVSYINQQVMDGNLDLSSLNGKVIQINIIHKGKVTQTILLHIIDDSISYMYTSDQVDYVVKINTREVPEIVSKIQEGNTKWLLAKLAMSCGKDCVGIAKELISSNEKPTGKQEDNVVTTEKVIYNIILKTIPYSEKCTRKETGNNVCVTDYILACDPEEVINQLITISARNNDSITNIRYEDGPIIIATINPDLLEDVKGIECVKDVKPTQTYRPLSALGGLFSK